MKETSRLCEPRLDAVMFELSQSEVGAVSGGLRLPGVLERIIDLVDRFSRFPPRL